MIEMDARDRDLVNVLQSEVPLSSTPYALIGQMLDMSEKEVIKRTERLKREGVVRRISGSFVPKALGYQSCLVAAKVDDDNVERSAAMINLHPGVTQNYLRNHDFNLWFTISVPPDSKLGLERTVEILGDEAQCSAVRLLPTLKLLKNVNLDSSEQSGNDTGSEDASEEHPALTKQEIEFLRLLQRDLPLQPRPFDTLASGAGSSGDDLLAAARDFQKRHQMRKLSALVDTRKPSFSATTMGVWVVPADRTDEFGALMGEFSAVSHCYLRPVYPDWPYNIFTTVHGRSVDECDAVLGEIAQKTGYQERSALYPTRELKRIRLSFFSPEIEVWEQSHSGAASANTAVS
jgi:DNA-binding Lrp family transcriptional regulator